MICDFETHPMPENGYNNSNIYGEDLQRLLLLFIIIIIITIINIVITIRIFSHVQQYKVYPVLLLLLINQQIY